MQRLSLMTTVNRINPTGSVKLSSQIIVSYYFTNKKKKNLLKNFSQNTENFQSLWEMTGISGLKFD